LESQATATQVNDRSADMNKAIQICPTHSRGTFNPRD